MKNILIGIVGVIIGVCLLFVFSKKNAPVFSSVADNGIYTASSSDSTGAGLYLKYKGAVASTELTPGVLGSFVITGTSATAIEIMNATSSTDVSSTTLAKFAASTAAGTYTFDAAFSRGLMVNYLGSYTGKGTITYR